MSTCPFCRKELFPQPTNPFLSITVEEGQDYYLRRQNCHINLFDVADILYHQGKYHLEQQWRDWHQSWVQAVDDPSAESLIQATLAAARINLREGYDNTINLATQIARLAPARNTRGRTEYRFYCSLQPHAFVYLQKLDTVGGEDEEEICIGITGPPQDELTVEQEEWLSGELDRRGAFEMLPNKGMGESPREDWEFVRELGAVWDTDEEVWSTCPY